MFLSGCARSPFRDFECYLRIFVGLDKDDIQLISEEYNSNFITFELPSDFYSIKDFSNVVHNVGDHEGTLQIKNDDISMKTKLNLTRFGGTFGTLRFNDEAFFDTLLGFAPYWDYEPTYAFHADTPDKYTSETITYLSTEDKILFKMWSYWR